MRRSTASSMMNCPPHNGPIFNPGWRLSQCGRQKSSQKPRGWRLSAQHSPNVHFRRKRVSKEAKQLENALRRRRMLGALKMQLAAVLLIAAGWAANSLTETLMVRQDGQTVDKNFILAAREALRVAQLDAGPAQGTEGDHDKIERLVGAINITMPQLPPAWVVTDVQVQPWNGMQSLVVRANTPSLGPITLVAAPMNGEEAIPPTLAADGRISTVYWQSGGTAYALMGPAAPERLEREAKGIEVATRKNLGPKIRG